MDQSYQPLPSFLLCPYFTHLRRLELLSLQLLPDVPHLLSVYTGVQVKTLDPSLFPPHPHITAHLLQLQLQKLQPAP